MPLVSVVIPAYNVEGTIAETIRSIQAQTLTDFELIVINDGSTDRTLEIVNAIQDPRLQVYSYPNGGLPTARNRGIDRATTEFITFIDGDDLWTPDKLESQYNILLQHPEAGVVYSWTAFMDAQGKSFHTDTPLYYQGNVYPQLLVNNFIASGSNVMIRRQAIESVGKFDSSLRSCEDWDYWLRLAQQWPFVVMPKAQILYRRSSGAMSSKIDVMEEAFLMIQERSFSNASPKLQHLAHRSLSDKYQYLTQLCIMYGGDAATARKASHYLWKSVRLYPKTLLNRKTQTLLVKLLVIRLLSPKLAASLFKVLGRLKASSVQTIQSST